MSAPLLIVNARPWSGRALDGDTVLVHDGRIVAVGRRSSLRDERAAQNVIDAHGGTVTPGLVDAHVHLVPWARARRQPDLHGCASRDAALERVRAALAATPDTGAEPSGEALPALIGRGWDDAGWAAPPEASALDAIAPDRPVLLHRHDFHALWVNTAALRAAGVSRDTPDPEAGKFDRGPGGGLTGLVREHAVRAFQALEDRAAPVVDEALLDDAAAALHAEGVTAIHDFQRTQADWERTRALAARRRLRVLQHVGPEQAEDARRLGIRGGAPAEAGSGEAWFRTGSLKLFADGTLGSRTAAMLEPYADTPGRGMVLLTAAQMAAHIDAAAAAGCSVAIHAIGDAAVRHALDAIESRREALARLALPPRIEHVQVLHADDLGRFAAVGVAASMQPQHATTDAAVARRAWGARCALGYPWRALLATGVTLAFGSDAPVEPPCARLGLAAAVARIGADGVAFESGQSLTLDEALLAYTASAHVLAGGGLGSGRLEPGAPADLVVWDRDLHTAGPRELAEARPRLTALAGEIVYDSRFDARARREAPGQAARA
ncbi:MAG TPA: amidohydrolase [Methylomirabilota bacterium]|nr:amidohydrolase [Methylomirabilota bacterium]